MLCFALPLITYSYGRCAKTDGDRFSRKGDGPSKAGLGHSGYGIGGAGIGCPYTEPSVNVCVEIIGRRKGASRGALLGFVGVEKIVYRIGRAAEFEDETVACFKKSRRLTGIHRAARIWRLPAKKNHLDGLVVEKIVRKTRPQGRIKSWVDGVVIHVWANTASEHAVRIARSVGVSQVGKYIPEIGAVGPEPEPHRIGRQDIRNVGS